MYAVIETGGKQYRVAKGDVIDIELLPTADKEKGAVTFDRVLFVGGDGVAKLGTPTLAGATVQGAVVAPVRAPKVMIFKKKKRKGYRRLQGHRQDLLRVRIEEISP